MKIEIKTGRRIIEIIEQNVKVGPINGKIIERQLRLFGHIYFMPNNTLAKKFVIRECHGKTTKEGQEKYGIMKLENGYNMTRNKTINSR